MNFENKVVLVTGASSGIGAATAVAFSAAGARLAIVGRNEAKMAAVAQHCADPLIIRAELSNDEDVKRIMDETIKKYGRLDILINNAGLTISGTSILNGDIMKSYDMIMSVNVRAVIFLTKLAAPHLIKTKGNIINISSVAGHITPLSPTSINYYVSKAALNHFSSCAACELGAHGVRVNLISPGPVKTDFIENAKLPYSWKDLEKTTLLGRTSNPEEIADLCLFVASEKGRGITGSNYIVDNGMQLKR